MVKTSKNAPNHLALSSTSSINTTNSMNNSNNIKNRSQTINFIERNKNLSRFKVGKDNSASTNDSESIIIRCLNEIDSNNKFTSQTTIAIHQNTEITSMPPIDLNNEQPVDISIISNQSSILTDQKQPESCRAEFFTGESITNNLKQVAAISDTIIAENKQCKDLKNLAQTSHKCDLLRSELFKNAENQTLNQFSPPIGEILLVEEKSNPTEQQNRAFTPPVSEKSIFIHLEQGNEQNQWVDNSRRHSVYSELNKSVQQSFSEEVNILKFDSDRNKARTDILSKLV